MEAILVNFRGAYKSQKASNQMIVKVDGITSKEEAEKLVGKKVIWSSPAGRDIIGQISAPHGSKGTVRAIFEKGMPGQSIGAKAKVE